MYIYIYFKFLESYVVTSYMFRVSMFVKFPFNMLPSPWVKGHSLHLPSWVGSNLYIDNSLTKIMSTLKKTHTYIDWIENLKAPSDEAIMCTIDYLDPTHD